SAEPPEPWPWCGRPCECGADCRPCAGPAVVKARVAVTRHRGVDNAAGRLKVSSAKGVLSEPTLGVEPTTYSLRKHCSSAELSRRRFWCQQLTCLPASQLRRTTPGFAPNPYLWAP